MCREHKGLVVFASLFGLLQSALWVAVTTVLILIYYCVIPVAEYKDKSNFFEVTLIKLYFEGPKCIPDGSYLGKFNEDYRTSITLIGREVLMFVLIAYVILSAIYFVLSMLLYIKRRRTKKRLLTTSWGVFTLIMCALDFLITYTFVIDSLTLMDYFSETPDLHDVFLGTIPYIPLLLSLVSSRLVVIWIWNFFIGIYVLFLGLCGRTVPEPTAQEINFKAEDKTPNEAVAKVAEKAEEKPKVVQNGVKRLCGPQRPTEDGDSYLNLISENYRREISSDMMKAYPEYPHYRRSMEGYPEYPHYRRSMEAMTKFSDEDRMSREFHPHSWCYEPPSETLPYVKSQLPRMREETNEGYVDDEEDKGRFDRRVDFQHNLKNFESGQQKLKIIKAHSGKSVGVPVPPPLPPVGSCNC